MEGLKNKRSGIIHGLVEQGEDVGVVCGVIDPKPLEYMEGLELVEDEEVTCGRCKRVLAQREASNTDFMERMGMRVEKLDHGGARVHYKDDYRDFNTHPDKLTKDELEQRLKKYFEMDDQEVESVLQPKTCACGCGGVPRGKKSQYLQGHDAKHKSKLMKAMKDGDTEAKRVLEEKGWL